MSHTAGMPLAEFLLARIAEDEEAARAASPGPWHLNAERTEVIAVDDIQVAEAFALSNNQLRATAEHIARWDPARVLAECDAKRRLVTELVRMQDEEMGWDGVEDKVMSYLALPYADHPEYREEWRP